MVSQRELDSVKSFLKTVRIVEDSLDGPVLINARIEHPSIMSRYIENHAYIYLKALELINDVYPPEQPIRALELGSAPYFFTVFVQEWRRAEVTPVSIPARVWPGEPLPYREKPVCLAVGPDQRIVELRVRVFNIEKDPFPFPADTFDLVLLMEVLEHLTYSPTHVLYETHRVLKPTGHLLITVPNCLSIKRLVLSLFNQTFEYPYSGYGVYGRHHREFAPHELRALLEACNYRVEKLYTDNAWRYNPRSSFKRWFLNRLLDWITSLPVPYLAAKRDYIFALSRPVGQPRAGFPEFLYRFRHLYPEYNPEHPEDEGL